MFRTSLHIFLILLLIINSTVVYSSFFYTKGIDQGSNPQLTNQAIYSFEASTCTKIKLNHLPKTYTSFYFSFDSCLKEYSHLRIILSIISETSSGKNMRLSSFQFTQNSTST